MIKRVQLAVGRNTSVIADINSFAAAIYGDVMVNRETFLPSVTGP